MMPRTFLLLLLGLASVPLIVGVWEPAVGQMGILLTLLSDRGGPGGFGDFPKAPAR